VPEGRCTGAYTTRRDGGIAYEYEATWRTTGNSAIWNSEVRREGLLVGVPAGTILNVQGADLEAMVKSLVEDAIEKRSGVS
jgi:hypothetical protein